MPIISAIRDILPQSGCRLNPICAGNLLVICWYFVPIISAIRDILPQSGCRLNPICAGTVRLSAFYFILFSCVIQENETPIIFFSSECQTDKCVLFHPFSGRTFQNLISD